MQSTFFSEQQQDTSSAWMGQNGFSGYDGIDFKQNGWMGQQDHASCNTGKGPWPGQYQQNSLLSMALMDFDSMVSSFQQPGNASSDHNLPANHGPFRSFGANKEDDHDPFDPIPLPAILTSALNETADDVFGGEMDNKLFTLDTPTRPRAVREVPQVVQSLPPPFPANPAPVNSRKRSASPEEAKESPTKRFRPYQAEQWTEKFEELCEFRKQNGHCLVPHNYHDHPLARWVKRQRYQYKLKKEGKSSTMTDERVVALENIGFIWDSHAAAWQERLNELAEYKAFHSDCNVPSNYSANTQLATWVKCQRRQYKLFWEGKVSNMTTDRIAHLEKLGFEWELRGAKSKKNAP